MKHLFLISWIRAREKKLADQVDLDRMIGAQNIKEAFKVLNDTDYAPYISGKDASNIEEVIEEERKDFKKTLDVMGIEKEVLEIFNLKDKFDSFSKKHKVGFFEKGKEKKQSLSNEEDEIFQRAEKEKLKEFYEIDTLLLDMYFEKVISFLKKQKEKEAEIFFQEYCDAVMGQKEDLEKRDNLLLRMEDELIEKSREEISGIIPVIAFFIKKRRVENYIRTIFAGKRMGVDSSKIYELIKTKRAL